MNVMLNLLFGTVHWAVVWLASREMDLDLSSSSFHFTSFCCLLSLSFSIGSTINTDTNRCLDNLNILVIDLHGLSNCILTYEWALILKMI